MIDFFTDKTIIAFVEKFGGDFYYSVPDKLPFYSKGENIYPLENQDSIKLAEKSLNENKNLFLYLETDNLPDDVIV